MAQKAPVPLKVLVLNFHSQAIMLRGENTNFQRENTLLPRPQVTLLNSGLRLWVEPLFLEVRILGFYNV